MKSDGVPVERTQVPWFSLSKTKLKRTKHLFDRWTVSELMGCPDLLGQNHRQNQGINVE